MINLRSSGKVLFIVFFLAFIIFLPQRGIAQLAVDNTTYTPQQLVQDIFLGNGVDVTNVTTTVADNRQLGYFTNSNSNLQISEGIMLSTGYTDEMSIAGNNTDDAFFSDSGGGCVELGLCGAGDADLDAVLGSTTYDAVVLEFDFIPLSNTIEFNYVFASEEYNEYVCSDFNDAFAFFVTGVTTPFPTTNIAIVPGSTPPLPVAINSVNNGSSGDPAFFPISNCSGTEGSLAFSSLFIDNIGPGGVFGGFNGGPFVEFDGLTVTLTATATVIPCETYHIKLALADAFDGQLDSGVFLEANSFTSGIVDVDVSTASVDPLVVEDCTGDIATVTLTLQETQATDYIIPLDIFGTAINGTDYITIPPTLTIPAGQNSATFFVDPIDDGIPEGVETVMIGVQTSVCTSDTITVYITQNPPIPTPNLSCNTSLNSIEFTWDADPGVLSYEISLDGGTTWQAPIPGPTSHLVAGLNQGDMATIQVRPVGACNIGNITSLTCTAQACTPAVTLASSAPDITCQTNSITLTPTPTGIQGNASYQWSTGVTDNGGTGTITAMGDYTVTISDDFNSACTATATISIGEDFMMPSVNITAPLTEFNCSQLNNILLTANPTVQGTASYQWNLPFMGTNMTALAPSADTYTVVVTDNDNGCTATATITLAEDFLDPVLSLIPSGNEFNCGVTEMVLETTGTYQGTPTYVWSAGALPVPTQDSALILAPGSFSVTVTDDDNGCTASASVTLGTDYLAPSVSLTSSQPQFTCATNSMNLTAFPVTQGFTSYAWSSGAVGIGDVVTITAPGDYTVTITDEDNGCTATGMINVPEDPTPPTIVLSASEPEFTCSITGSINLNVFAITQGTPSYQWSAGVTGTGTNVSVAAMGDYTVTLTDSANSCTSTATVNIGEDILAPMVSLTSDESEFNCDINSIVLTPTAAVQGTATYQWSGGVTDNGGTGTITAPGDYTVTITDSDNGCTATTSITLAEDVLAPVVSLVPDESEFNCDITSIILSPNSIVQGTASYQWSVGVMDNGGTGTVTNPGDYTVTVTDSDNGCTATTSITLAEDVLTPSVTLASNEPEFNCNITAVTLTASSVVQGTATYQWSAGVTENGASGTIIASGDYTVTVTDSDNGCTVTTTINIGEDVLNPGVLLTTDVPELNCIVGTVNIIATATVQGTAIYQWSTGVTDNGNTGAVTNTGDYTVTITDSDNGCTMTSSITIGENVLTPAVSLSSDESEFNCIINSIILTPTPTVQGTATYQWSSGVTDNGGTGTITSPGDYTVTITDSANGCTGTAMITLNEDVLAPAVSLASDETEFNCNVNSIVLTPTPTVQGTATYQWSSGVTDNGGTGTITVPGDYTVTITDSDNGCTTTTSITLGEDALLPAVTLASDEPEFDCTITSIVLTPTATVQGTASYQWSAGVMDNGGTGTITIPGDYTVTITDSDNGCTATNTITLGEDPLDPAVSITSDEPEFNCNVSSIVLTATPMVQGTASYEWSTSVADISNTVTITAIGDYTVTITDSDNGCTTTNLITITEDLQAPIVALSSDESEFNCNISSIVLTPIPTSQGTPSYQWSAGVTDNGGTGTITAMGDYTVTITDADNGCTGTAMISIGENFLAPGVSLASDEAEFNCNVNTIVLTPTPTVQGTASYQWSAGVTDIGGAGSITSMGDYTVTITDSDNGCTMTTSISIGENFTAPTAVIVPSGTQLYCTVTSISLDASTSTSQGALTYAWSSGVSGSGPIVSVTAAGNYTVTITDINGCTDETSVSIQAVAPVMLAELVTSDATCNGSDDGSISVVASGGDGNYSYAWNGDAAGSMDVASGLSPNTYTVTVTDGLACTATYSYEVTEPLPIIPTLTQTDVTCAGLADGTATASATGGTIVGGYGFAWSTIPMQNTPTANGLIAGTYTVTVTDDNMCTATESIMVNEPLALSLQISGTDVSCAGEANGSATVMASDGTPGYTYLWNNIPPSLTPTASSLVAGTYTVTVTDLNDCTATQSIVINEPMAMSVTAIATQIQTDCEFPDGAAQVSASNGAGGYAYAWGTTPGQSGTDASNLTAGTYFVTATDANGCTASTSVDIGSTFTINPVETIVNVDCNGSATGSISIVTTGDGMNGPFTYTWNDGSNDNPYNNLTAGTYTVVISDINNCSVTQPYVITEPTELTITVIDVNDSSCSSSADGSITIAVNGGMGNYTYTWDGAAVGQDDTVNNIPFGNYVVVVVDENGCTATETISVGTPAPIVITLLGTTAANCTACDGTANVSVSGGTAPYTFVWPNGNNSPMPTNLCSGVNTITVLDANGCSETLDVIVDNVTTLVIDNISVSDTDCPDSCDGAASISASGGLPPYSYIWDANTGSSVVDEAFDLCSGSYGVTVTDQNGCIVSDIANIASPDPLYMELGSIDVVCFGEQNGAVTIDSVSGGTGPYGYSLDNELFIFDTIFPFQYSGDYTVYVEDANGCLDSSMTFVYEPPQLLVTAFPLDTLINLGESVELNAIPNQNNTTLLWTPGDSLSCTDCPNPITNTYATTEYTVLVTDTILGCTTSENLLVRINKDRDIYVPNAFTPNNDGANDFVSVYAGGDVVRINTFRIFDRWGEMVFERLDFEANSPELGWDGFLNGKRMNPAVYVYFVEAEFIDGHVEKVAGDVTLVD